MQILNWLTDASSLTPHGFCLFWEPWLLRLYVVSDAMTMVAYYSIPLALGLLIRRRPHFPYPRTAALFCAFIVACGTSHGLSILTLWVPAYHLEASVKLLTACLSFCSAVVLWPLLPRLLELPSAEEMTNLNRELRHTIRNQTQIAIALTDSQRRLLSAKQELANNNAALEQRIAERTAELTRLNESISRNEARFRQVVEAAPTAMIMTNSDGLIVLVNAQTERLFGYERRELLGQSVEILIPVEHRARHPGLRTMFWTEPHARQMGARNTLFALKKDGTRFEVEIGLNPIETDDGAMVLSAIVDMSEQLRLAEQLRQAQKMEAIGRVTAGVAHDFNNLLQSLGGSMELLLDAVADRPAARNWGEVALRAIGRAGELTSRLLSFSGKQLLRAGPVPLGRLLADLQQLINHLFESEPSGKTRLVVVPGPPDLAVLADASQLEAALINLAMNAREAMPDGGCLRISAFETEADPTLVQPGRYIVISVADTGVGMDAATLAQACEPFFTTKGLNGTGLGLSMVQGFARQSGGAAHIISVVGEGTTVELWLPSATEPPVASGAVRPDTTRNGRVLLVDDSPDVLLIVGSFLRHAGFEVTAVSSAEQALAELAASARFDVIVTDYLMPVMNGLDLLLRAREIAPGMVGMIITGFSDPLALPELSGVMVVRKPFNRAELTAKVRGLLGADQTA